MYLQNDFRSTIEVSLMVFVDTPNQHQSSIYIYIYFFFLEFYLNKIS